MTLQTTFASRDDSLMAPAEIMALATEVGNGFHLLRSMGIVANSAFAINRRRMPHSLLPVGINFMTIDTESRLLLQQITLFIVAVGMVTNRTVLMSRGGAFSHLAPGVTGHTETVCGTGQQKRLFAGVGIMAQRAAPFGKRLMSLGFFPFIFNLLMTSGT